GADPAPPVGAARREPAGVERDGVPAGELDLDAARRRDVAARGDRAAVGEQLERIVDGGALDDAVQVELDAGAREQRPDEPETPPGRNCGASGRALVVHELREVAVVAGGGDRGANGRRDDATGR